MEERAVLALCHSRPTNTHTHTHRQGAIAGEACESIYVYPVYADFSTHTHTLELHMPSRLEHVLLTKDTIIMIYSMERLFLLVHTQAQSGSHTSHPMLQLLSPIKLIPVPCICFLKAVCELQQKDV